MFDITFSVAWSSSLSPNGIFIILLFTICFSVHWMQKDSTASSIDICRDILWLEMKIEKRIAFIAYILPCAAYMPRSIYICPDLIKFHLVQVCPIYLVVEKALDCGQNIAISHS